MNNEQARALLLGLYRAAVQRAQPSQVMAQFLPPPPKGRTVVVGAGKAAGAMALAFEAAWPAHAPLSGVVVTRYGHIPPLPAGLKQRIEILQAAHPVPDEAGLRASERIGEAVQGLGPDDLVVCLISGGGSALLTLPQVGLTLEDKRRINQALLLSGAPIDEMNTVRKHLSRIKGGQLARACGAARVLTLAISDVPGDDPAVIASGPTVADPSTCADALAILQRRGIAVPDVAMQALQSGAWETPKPGGELWQRHELIMMATPAQSLQAAADFARAQGLQAHILSDEIEGESRDVGGMHAALAKAVALGKGAFPKPCVILSGGETTVTVDAKAPSGRQGRGGRAGEFCLGLVMGLRGQAGVWGLAADTDGIDGVEHNAGALVQPDTWQRALQAGLSVHEHVASHDSFGFFEALGDLVVTGPTHTNVNDFRALLVV
ncbi:MAG: glycerate kinase [Betaproteobacteria bacterium]|jgi:glycerate 2-kinase|nr:glycerate kinase [Betaproteobacteria bacterium]